MVNKEDSPQVDKEAYRLTDKGRQFASLQRKYKMTYIELSKVFEVIDGEGYIKKPDVKVMEEARGEKRERILVIIEDWDKMADPDYEGDGDADFKAKYGQTTTELIDVVRQALKEGTQEVSGG